MKRNSGPGLASGASSQLRTEVMDFLSTKFTKDKRFVKLKPVIEFASRMLSHLLIASMSVHLLVYFVLGTHYRSQKSWREEKP